MQNAQDKETEPAAHETESPGGMVVLLLCQPDILCLADQIASNLLRLNLAALADHLPRSKAPGVRSKLSSMLVYEPVMKV